MTHTKIAIVAFDGCLASSIALPREMLSAANDYSRVNKSSTLSSIDIVAATRYVRCAGNTTIKSDSLLKDMAGFDLIILPALWRNPLTAINKQRKIIKQLPHWYSKNAQICAVGSASFLLAEAGLLDRRAATTHWVQAKLFSRRYPLVNYQKDFLITQSDRIYCAASVNSLADLTIHFIENIYGQLCAQHVETNFSPEARTPFSASFYNESDKKNSHQSNDHDIARLLSWLEENIAQKHSNLNMAQALNLSERALNRRFKKVTGQSPQAWLETTRMSYAKKLLRQTQLSLNDIAEDSGYSDRSYFSKRFKKYIGLSPIRYRQTLRKKLIDRPDDF